MFVLNDADPESLQFAKAKLGAFAEKCVFVPGNALMTIRELARHGPFDLVMAGGLCDYLSDRQITFLIKQAVDRLLLSGGTFFLTNIAAGNPFRYWMEYFANWTLIERSEEHMRGLCRSAGVPDEAVTLSRDKTHLTILAEIVKA